MPSILYFVANSLPSFKNVVVEALVLKASIIDLNRPTIIDRNSATFHTSEIIKTISITDRKGNNYDKAIDIYTDDTPDCVFIIGTQNKFNLPIKCYFTRDTAIANFIYNKPQKCISYSDEGDVIRNGLIFNGLFTGYIKTNSSIVKYKDGIMEI